jgi:hypothetical protein
VAVKSDVSWGLLTPGPQLVLPFFLSGVVSAVIHLHEDLFSIDHATLFPVAKRRFNMQKLC